MTHATPSFTYTWITRLSLSATLRSSRGDQRVEDAEALCEAWGVLGMQSVGGRAGVVCSGCTSAQAAKWAMPRRVFAG